MNAQQPTFSMDDFAKALEQDAFQSEVGKVVRGQIFRYETNGVYVDIRGKSLAFLPLAEVSLGHCTTDDLPNLLPLESEQDFLIIREQNDDGQITVSRRRLEIQRQWEQLAEEQDVKKSRVVRVTGVNRGGVTVDIRGLRGFIPRSQLLDSSNLESLIGRTLTTVVIEANPDTRKLVLSERQAAQMSGLEHLQIGQLVEGTISSIKPFGLILRFGAMSGLLHINQISKAYISSLNELFQVGQSLKAIVTDVDEGRGRVSLSTKPLETFPGEILQQLDQVMATAETRLKKPETGESDPESA